MNLSIIGGGQLGKMLALAAVPLGIRCTFLDELPDAPAGQVASLVTGKLGDPRALDALVSSADAVTFETESVPAASLAYVAERFSVHPSPVALAASQDRLHEKALFASLGIPSALHMRADSFDELSSAVDFLGYPAIVKTRTGGYDGKGQMRVASPEDVREAWKALGHIPLIVEAVVPFAQELSIVAVRDRCGRVEVYRPSANVHREGVLRLSLATSDAVSAASRAQAETYVRRIVERLDYVGVLTLELFDTTTGLVANEIAPRVHNSGHWTIEGTDTSQFENHVRAVCGLPLGGTEARGEWAMINLIGDVPSPRAVLSVPGAKLHVYGKALRPGRKVGHITVGAPDCSSLLERLSTFADFPGVEGIAVLAGAA